MEKIFKWSEIADVGFKSLIDNYWNTRIRMFNNHYPNIDNYTNLTFHYWWYAHSIDSLVDAYERTKDKDILNFIREKYDGLVLRNGGQPLNLLYDDMEWLALALLRVYKITNDPVYLRDVKILWEDIKKGWTEEAGGGIAWHKEIMHYKNTPANAPAIILSARLYQMFQNENDLEWANKIFKWQELELVNPENGFVNDGKNNNKDGKIDASAYTYCQGVYIGACVELYKISNNRVYLDKALLTAKNTIEIFENKDTGTLISEGIGDGGLFKGILIRYLTEFIALLPDETNFIVEFMMKNARSLWKNGFDKEYLIFNDDWGVLPNIHDGASLSVHLSGLFLFESMAKLERLGFV